MTIEVRIFPYEIANSLRVAFFLGFQHNVSSLSLEKKRLLLTLLSKGRDNRNSTDEEPEESHPPQNTPQWCRCGVCRPVPDKHERFVLQKRDFLDII